MSRAIVWQRALIAVALFGILQLAVTVYWAHVIDGYNGINWETTSAFRDRVDSVDPGSPGARAGFKAGDVVDIRMLSRSDRFKWRAYLLVGERYKIPVLRAGKQVTLTIFIDRWVSDLPFWAANRWNWYVRFVGIACLLAVAAFLVWRRPESEEIRLFSLSLILIAIGTDFSPGAAWSLRTSVIGMLGLAIGPFLENAGLALLATYALRFALPPSRLRVVCTRLTYVLAGFAAIAACVGDVGQWYGVLDTNFGFFVSNLETVVTSIGPSLAAFLCALLAIREARGGERSRLVWAAGSLSILYLSPLVAFFLSNDFIGGISVYWTVTNSAYFVAAIGLVYSLLGRRLLDVGFALNRAAVFTTVSLVVVGSFTLVEWALGGWLASESRGTNVLVSGALALGLGLSIHPIHLRVDRFIDASFFRKRHEAEQALRTFAKEAAFITDPDVLVTRARDVLERNTDCSWVDVAVYDGDGRFGGIDENDPAIVTLRTSHQMVNLHAVDSAVRGEFAFPMSARGRLVGVLAIGPKRLGESYAPDEREAIAQLAHGVGIALDVLTVRREHAQDDRLDAILESNRAILAWIARVSDVGEGDLLEQATALARVRGSWPPADV
jgi:GAF domain-containing protein